jgi:hypothetical protein
MSDELTGGPFRKLLHKVKILSVASRAVKDGTLHAGMTEEEMTEVIAMGLIKEDPGTYLAAGFDWQVLLDLIVKLLPLIMAIFGL